MRRRICLVVGLVALGVPASGWAQSSSQAQYQGVAPETQLPVTGGGGGSAGGAAVTGGGGANGATSGGAATGVGATGGGTAASGGAKPTGTSAGGATAQQAPALSLPAASTSTSPIGGGDILWIVLAAAGLTVLGLLLRRNTRRHPAGA